MFPGYPGRPPRRRLLVFCKYPEPGRVKTRLARSIGFEAAAQVARDLARLTIERLSQPSRSGIRTILFAEPAAQIERFRALAGEDWRICPQPEGDLGKRLEDAFAAETSRRLQTVVVGSDCPGITATVVYHAFAAIGRRQIVFGPTEDGGFYLMGAEKLPRDFFGNIPWSSDVTLKELSKHSRECGFRIRLLPTMYDIDTRDDLERWRLERQ